MKITSASNHCSCDSIRELVELVWLKLVIVRGGHVASPLSVVF